VIKDFFVNYRTLSADLTVRLGDGTLECQGEPQVDWTVHLIETGVTTNTELDGLDRLAKDADLMAFRHKKFWQCMDTLRDHRLLKKH
jgi:NDP-sugar pyrophosphorylase family protein